MAATSTPAGDNTGAGSDRSGEHSPAWPELPQDCPRGQDGSAQQVSSTQLADTHSAGASQAPPLGANVGVGVTVGVSVTVSVDVAVAVAVAVRVCVAVAVPVAVVVAVAVAVAVRVSVAVSVPVELGVWVGVLVGVALGATPAQVPSQKPKPVAVCVHRLFDPMQLPLALAATPSAQLGPKQQPRNVAPINPQNPVQAAQLVDTEVHRSWLAPSQMQQSPRAPGTTTNATSIVSTPACSAPRSAGHARTIRGSAP
jgi:hypothetical protein